LSGVEWYRKKEIQAKLEGMPKTIADYRVSFPTPCKPETLLSIVPPLMPWSPSIGFQMQGWSDSTRAGMMWGESICNQVCVKEAITSPYSAVWVVLICHLMWWMQHCMIMRPVQESVKLKDTSLLDKLLLTVKERREKQFRVAK